jgi:hypothetical protein
VLLATVLFLTALSQSFRERLPRVAVLMVAFVLLAYRAFWIFSYPAAPRPG